VQLDGRNGCRSALEWPFVSSFPKIEYARESKPSYIEVSKLGRATAGVLVRVVESTASLHRDRISRRLCLSMGLLVREKESVASADAMSSKICGTAAANGAGVPRTITAQNASCVFPRRRQTANSDNKQNFLTYQFHSSKTPLSMLTTMSACRTRVKSSVVTNKP
jgi:hypothetical protein